MHTKEQLLRIAAVLAMTGMKRSTLYAEIRKGNFPKQIQLSSRCVAWKAESVKAFIESRSVA